jgi:CRISPR-associated protein Cas2
MARRRHLILYDIRDKRRLRKIFNTMRSHGSRFQYSVFLCDLNPSELLSLRWELKEIMNEAVDSIAIVDVGSPQSSSTDGTFEFLGARREFPSSEVTIL